MPPARVAWIVVAFTMGGLAVGPGPDLVAADPATDRGVLWLTGKGLPADNSWVKREQWKVRVERRADDGTPSRLAARWPVGTRTDARRLTLFIVVDPRPRP